MDRVKQRIFLRELWLGKSCPGQNHCKGEISGSVDLGGQFRVES